MPKKQRIDLLVFQKGLAPSRERAQAYIMAGKVLVDECKIEKAGQKVSTGSSIRILGSDQPYVSRGGLKLAAAIKAFNVNTKHKIAIDIGASTGGFTDCLLQSGAGCIYAIDSGTNQLAWLLYQNPRVISLERANFRYLSMDQIGTFVDLIVIDVSFISLKKILANCPDFLVRGGEILALIKPQFEAGKERIKRGGLVTDPKIHQEIIRDIEDFSKSIGLLPSGVIASPIIGKKRGNQEFLIHLVKTD